MGGKPRAPLALTDAWRLWVLNALRAGASPRLIADELVADGAPRRIAESEVELIHWTLDSDARGRRAELALRLYEHASRGKQLETRTLCSKDEFYQRYYATSTPVLFEDGCQPLGVVGRWTPEYLAERGGDRPIRVSFGRDAVPDHYADPESFYTEMPTREVVQRVLAAGASNDIYVVSRNRASEGALDLLADDFAAMPDFLEPDARMGGWSLWFGPAGTRTPLHHDTSPILFAQIYGRKRIHLIAPCERELLFGPIESTFYSSADLSAADVDIRVIDIEPGQALFMPVGYWHAVQSLDVSISISFTGFIPHHDYDWYRPGM